MNPMQRINGTLAGPANPRSILKAVATTTDACTSTSPIPVQLSAASEVVRKTLGIKRKSIASPNQRLSDFDTYLIRNAIMAKEEVRNKSAKSTDSPTPTADDGDSNVVAVAAKKQRLMPEMSSVPTPPVRQVPPKPKRKTDIQLTDDEAFVELLQSVDQPPPRKRGRPAKANKKQQQQPKKPPAERPTRRVSKTPIHRPPERQSQRLRDRESTTDWSSTFESDDDDDELLYVRARQSVQRTKRMREGSMLVRSREVDTTIETTDDEAFNERLEDESTKRTQRRRSKKPPKPKKDKKQPQKPVVIATNAPAEPRRRKRVPRLVLYKLPYVRECSVRLRADNLEELKRRFDEKAARKRQRTKHNEASALSAPDPLMAELEMLESGTDASRPSSRASAMQMPPHVEEVIVEMYAGGRDGVDSPAFSASARRSKPPTPNPLSMTDSSPSSELNIVQAIFGLTPEPDPLAITDWPMEDCAAEPSPAPPKIGESGGDLQHLCIELVTPAPAT